MQETNNLQQNPPLQQTAVICRLFDKMACEWVEYKQPIYTKLNGVYGYLSVSKMNVFFFWYDSHSENVSFDDITERFGIEYVIS